MYNDVCNEECGLELSNKADAYLHVFAACSLEMQANIHVHVHRSQQNNLTKRQRKVNE